MALKIYYQNVRGLRTKTSTFMINLLNYNYDVICLSETWLFPGIYNSELFDCRYNVYRSDRDHITSGKSTGGGTLIAVLKGLTMDVRSSGLSNLPDCEITAITLLLGSKPNDRKLRIFTCYFPHSANQVTSELTFFEHIADICLDHSSDEMLILGDFNISRAIWEPDKEFANTYVLHNPTDDTLLQNLNELLCITGLGQKNYISNKNDKILDLILASCNCLVTRCESLVPEDGHHPALCCVARCGAARAPTPSCLRPPQRFVRCFRSPDYSVLCSELEVINWNECLSAPTIDIAVEKFYTSINSVIEKYIPLVPFNNRQRYPLWYSKYLINTINKKLIAHKRWKTYGRVADYNTFSKLRIKQKQIMVTCYSQYIDRAEDKIRLNSKYFWSFIKSKKSNAELPDNMYYEDKRVNDGCGIANLFNKFFQSVFEADDNSCTPSQMDSSSIVISSSSIHIHVNTIEKYLKALDVTKGSGPDGIPPIFWNQCRSVLAYPIYLLFTKSFSCGIFPTVWKKSLITPIFKSGDKHNIKDYRGISKLSTIPKLLEKIVCDQVSPLLRPVLVDNQHGFIGKRSTETNLCEYIDDLIVAMDEGYQVDAVYTDYSKAFDKICHSILFQKLEAVGIHGDLLRWLKSYLTNRSQAVVVKGFTSAFIPITSGVPQGSHLGPLLFNVFINDVINCFQHSKVLLYADDTKIYTRVKNLDDCIKLQNDLDRLSLYCSSNGLHLNVKKCCVISFGRKTHKIDFCYNLFNENLKRVIEVRDLGLQLDSELLFRSHITNITSKAYKMLGFIFRQCNDFKQASSLILLYNSLVRSQLEYASVVWNPQYKLYIDSIQRIQDKFVKRLQYCFGRTFTDCMLPLSARRSFRDQAFLYRIVNNLVDSPHLLNKISLRCSMLTRINNTFEVPFCRTNYAMNRFLVRACKSYNELFTDADIFHLNYASFRRCILKYIAEIHVIDG